MSETQVPVNIGAGEPCPTCGEVPRATVRFGGSRSYPFCLKPKCREALLEATRRTARRPTTKYEELIYAVGTKYPGETRHETALRYIRQADTPTDNTPKCDTAIGTARRPDRTDAP